MALEIGGCHRNEKNFNWGGSAFSNPKGTFPNSVLFNVEISSSEGLGSSRGKSEDNFSYSQKKVSQGYDVEDVAEPPRTDSKSSMGNVETAMTTL
jgi:hypothetical protein